MLGYLDIRMGSLALVSILLGATGQFLFRVGMLQHGKVSVTNIWGQLWEIIALPPILAGFLCFGLSSVLWLVVISRWELSYAYPMVALGYVFVCIYGVIFLDERLNIAKVIALVLILAGITILGWFGQG